MNTLTVFKFPTADGAERTLQIVRDLQSKQYITLHDAAIVTWPADKKKPKTQQLSDMTGAGALGGAFWGLLFGLLFFIPLIGLAIGAGLGALAGSMADVGIDDKFIAEVRQKVVPGTSALFLMTSDAVVDRVTEAMRGIPMELISTNLPKEQEDKLRAVFAEEEQGVPTSGSTAEVSGGQPPTPSV